MATKLIDAREEQKGVEFRALEVGTFFNIKTDNNVYQKVSNVEHDYNGFDHTRNMHVRLMPYDLVQELDVEIIIK